MKQYLIHIIFLTILIFCTREDSSAEDYWKRIASPTTKPLSNCFFVNSSTGWVSGDSGTIIRTTNGGNSWTIQNSGTYNNIVDIFFLNERTGWALAWEIFPDTTSYLGTVILKTSNSGINWIKSMHPDTNMFFKTVHYRDTLNGFMGGTPAKIVYTSNGGNNWFEADIDTTLFVILPIFKIDFFNNQIGYACGGFRDIAGITWVTTNAGRNWKGSIIAPEPFFDISILYQQKAICSGGDLEYGSSIARTSNQGVNWFYDTLGVFGLATGIDFRTQSEGWMAAGYSQRFLFTSDTGNSWTSLLTPDNTAIFDVVFPDSTYGFAVGNDGAILKYDRTSSGNIAGNQNYFPERISLYQNYPNPFNPVTKISYELRVTSYASLKVFDVLGNEVKTFVNQKQNGGRYEVEFDGSNLPSGIYFYSLYSNGKMVYTKRMILIK